MDVAKDYGIDLTCLEAGNPRIADPTTLNPGDCIQIPRACSAPSTGELSASKTVSEPLSISTTPPSSGTSCPFTITATGGVDGIAGQLDDGQIRVNGSYPPTTFMIDNGKITDSHGRGCILTRELKTSWEDGIMTKQCYSFSDHTISMWLWQISDWRLLHRQ